jgi:tRNA U34 5-methylaminomethyl-2-thiouridine-forming methyltransferase MnmC
LKREIITTADGSTTIHIAEWNEQYHSKHGAIQEAYHVFIKHGLHLLIEQLKTKVVPQETSAPLSILEIGLGTGLNAFITFLEANTHQLHLNYVGVEAYPVAIDEIAHLNYVTELKVEHLRELFEKLHESAWEVPVHLDANFTLTKQQKMFHDIEDKDAYHLIYFDAFGARVQPELWTEAIFKIMYAALKPEGIIVTYAAKGSVRRAMQAVGFTVERLPGPPGKREMLRGVKPSL